MEAKTVHKARLTQKQADIICTVYHYYNQHGEGPNVRDIFEILGGDLNRIRAMVSFLVRDKSLCKATKNGFNVRFLPAEFALETLDSPSVISEEDLLLLDDIKFLAHRDKCYPTFDLLSLYSNENKVKTSKSIKKLIDANLLIHEKINNVINRLIPVDFFCKIIADRYLISVAEGHVLCAIYHACEILHRYPTVKELINLTGYSTGRIYPYVNALITHGIVTFEGTQPYSVKPLLYTPQINAVTLTAISNREADILRFVYNQCSDGGKLPETKDIADALGIRNDEINRSISNLIDSGILWKNVNVRPPVHYILEGNGCDHISYPSRAASYKRISESEADFLNSLYSLSDYGSSVMFSSFLYDKLGRFYSQSEISQNTQSLIRHKLLSRVSGKHAYKLTHGNVSSHNPVFVKNTVRMEKPLNLNQLSVMYDIRSHILRFGIPPKPRDLSCNYEVLVNKNYIYLADGEKTSKIRVSHGVGFDDVAGDLPVETELTNRVYQTIVDCISEYVAQFGDTREDVISGLVRNNCFTTVDEVAKRSGLSDGDLKKCLSALRMLGKIRDARDNRYGLKKDFITL